MDKKTDSVDPSSTLLIPCTSIEVTTVNIIFDTQNMCLKHCDINRLVIFAKIPSHLIALLCWTLSKHISKSLSGLEFANQSAVL